MRRFVSLPKLESSPNVTSKVMSNRIKARKSKWDQNPQINMIASFPFASTAHVTQWSNNPTQRAEILTRRSNLTLQQAKNTEWFVCGVCGTDVAFDIKEASFTVSSLFFPETSKLQSAVYSEWKLFWLTPHCCWIHWEKMISCSRTWSISWHHCSHNRAAKHIKNLLSSSKVITD